MSKLAELQTTELDILREFIRVANAKDLRWFGMFGTLLGASRCGGFIPWDDDVDIAMPRPDYDRLLGMSDMFDEPYFLQTPANDPAAAVRFIKLRRSDTAVIDVIPNVYTNGGHKGAYIDIIPLDIVPDYNAAKKLQKVAHAINKQMYYSAALDENDGEEVPAFKEDACILEGGIAGQYSYFADRYERYCSKYKSGYYYSMPSLMGERGCYVYDRKWFAMSDEMDFEDLKIKVPMYWKDVLVVSYPNGLHEPAMKYRKPKHIDKNIVDTKQSYKVYTRRYTDMLKGIGNKRIYFFGAGDSLRIWLERYGHGLDIACTFDNDPKKWGTTAYGVPVRNPAELPRMLVKNDRVIIVSIYHKEIGKQLKGLGVKDYFIFIDGLKYQR